MAVRQRVPAHGRFDDASVVDAGDAAPRVRYFGALGRHPVFRRLWLGAFASSAGQWMQQVALGWLAIIMTDSPGFVGLVTFAAGLPFIVVSPLGGALIDRVDRRRLMLVCQALAFVLAMAVAVDIMGGFVQPWHLPLLAFLNGALMALVNPTQQALVPALVPREDLTNAIGLMSAGMNLTRVVGPSLAGIMIGTLGIGQTFLGQAAVIAVSFFLVLGVVLPPRPPRTGDGQGIFDGIRLIVHRPDLRGLFLLASIPTLFVFPYLGFLNVFARDILHIGAEGLGLLMAAPGAGAVVGSLLVAAWGRVEGAGRLLIWLTLAYGAAILGVALSRDLWITLLLLFLAGLIGAGFMSGNNAVLQHRISDEIRGRVIGAYMLIWGFMPLGALPMGLVADRIGTPLAVAAGAIVSTGLAALLGLLSPALRDI